MPEAGSVSEWIENLRSGDSHAATRLWNRFHAGLLKVARRRLGRVSRHVADEEDLVALAFESFFERIERGQFPDVQCRADLWALLVTITHRKAVNCVRRHFSVKRGGGRVYCESTSNVRVLACDEGLLAGIDSGTPAPERLVSLRELFTRLDGDMQRIVALRLDGCTNEQIAQRLNRSLATIERRLRLLRDEWTQELLG
ncbi:MAG: ECF-type sigma factor [Pirellulaceae bacterium]|jgi:RNA polymerase sigma factor (sigma-70 family)|nr:ECF-type sigma factor [Pirellulaceae bacterium]